MSGKRMFEFVEGSSSKFWEIWRDGSEVRTRYGKIGSDGQTTVKDEGTDEKAEKLYNKLIKEKTGKGYKEKGGGDAAPAPAASTPAPAPAPKAAAKAAPAPAPAAAPAASGGGGFKRYEVDEKFWAIKLDGSSHTVKFGKIGTNGAEKTKEFDSEAAAKKDHDKLVKEKTGKGYELVDGGDDEEAAPAKPAKAAAPAPAASAPKIDAKPLIAKIEAKAKKAGVELPAGASAAAIAGLEKTLGFALPDDMKAYYLAHDGGPEDADTFVGDKGDPDSGRELLSIERIAGEWKIWKDLLDKGTFEDNDHGEPDKGVQQKWWIAEWVPVTYDGSGNHHVVDVAPGKGGTHGQILSFWHDDAPRTLVAKSFLEWLASDKTAFFGDGDEGGDDDEDGDGDGEGGGWRRFEVDEKFWMIKLDGSSHTVKFGKQGTDGQEKTKDFDDEAAAKKDYDKLVKEKTGKGYEEVED